MVQSILVTGGNGLVGNAIKQIKSDYSYYYIFMDSAWCDLRNYEQTLKVFKEFKPTYIIHLAACVGGLFKNMSQKVKMFEDNLLINTNVIKASHEAGIDKLICCLSTCIFPDGLTEPINETMLHNGPPHPSNEGYAYAKRIMEVNCRVYNEEFGRKYICIIPTNIYGPFDNFNLEDGHVIPSLIHKCYLAMQYDIPFEIRGTGKPLRQFIYSLDLAHLIMKLLSIDYTENIILSPEDEYSIEYVAESINRHFQNEMVFNKNYSDGQYRKTADNSKLKKLINSEWSDFKFTDLDYGIEQTVKWFIENYETLRK